MSFVPARLGVCLTIFLVLGCSGAPQSALDPPVPEADALDRPNAATGGETSAGGVPEKYQVKLETTKGDVVIEVNRSWAPRGADRFYELVQSGFYDGTKFFRVIDGFMAQIGINGNPTVQEKWRDANIKDDPVVESNKRGYVSFATSGPDSRSTQFFINFGDNSNLDGMGFSPFGRVVEGMDVVDSLYNGYGEGVPRGRGPDQTRIQYEGNAYLENEFPKLDAIEKATIVEE